MPDGNAASTSLTLPDGQVIALRDISHRQLVLPTQSTVRVPDNCEWQIVAMSVLPPHRYAPPIGAA
ncbi:MAG: hypothetical protein ACRDKS_03080, partial [Actinomycetota bacterium]